MKATDPGTEIKKNFTNTKSKKQGALLEDTTQLQENDTGSARKIAKNTLFLLIGQIVSVGIAFVYTIQIARYLGPTDFGVIATGFALTALFVPLTHLGLTTLATREVARRKSLANKYLGNLITIEVLLTSATFCLISLAAYLLRYPPETVNVIYIIALMVVCTAFANLFFSFFQAFELMQYLSLGMILNSVVTFIVVVYTSIEGLGTLWFAFAYFISSLIVSVYCVVTYGLKFSWPRPQVDFTFWRAITPEALPFALTGAFITIYYYIDSVMLSFMKGAEVVGWYNAAYRIILIVLYIPAIVNMAIFPTMSRFFVTAKDNFRLTYEKFFKYMAIIAMPIAVGTTILANRIIVLIYGVEYVNSAVALQILIWSTVFVFLGSAFARLFETSNRQITVTKITGLGMVANVALNLMLIPRFSYVGASVATALTEMMTLSLCLFVSSRIKYALPRSNLRYLFKTALASFLMGLLIVYLGNIGLFSILPAVATYFAMLYLFRVVEKDDIAILKSVVLR